MAAGQGRSDDQAPPSTAAATVTVAATVTDHDHRVVANLKVEHFTLYEDGVPHEIRSVTFGDVPACIGLVVDRSGSMRSRLKMMNATLIDLVRASNTEDRFFVVNFNDDAYMDQDLTQDTGLIGKGLSRSDARGGTALYDAVVASAEHLKTANQCQRRILILLSDGDDNESRETLQQATAAVQRAGNPAIYAINLPNDHPSLVERGRHTLDVLTAATGGTVFSAGNAKDIDKAALMVAEEIRNQYSLTYVPTHAGSTKKVNIKVEAHAPGYKDLVVRGSVAANADETQHNSSFKTSSPK